MLRALQCAYYIHNRSIVPDHEFDRMEAEYNMINDPLPLGSDKKESYTPAQRSLCLYFLYSGRFVQSSLL